MKSSFRPFTILSSVALIASLGTSAAASSAPQPVLSGLSRPDELAVSPTGDLYFIQSPTRDQATLWRLPRGAASPEEILRVPDGRAYLVMEPPIQSIGFDRRGNVYWVSRELTAPPSIASGHSAVVRLDRRAGRARELYGVDSSPPPGSLVLPNEAVTSGAEIDTLGVGSRGAVYFSQRSFDRTLGHMIVDVLRLASGASSPTRLARFEQGTGNIEIQGLAVARGAGSVGENDGGAADAPDDQEDSDGASALSDTVYVLVSDDATSSVYAVASDPPLRLITSTPRRSGARATISRTSGSIDGEASTSRSARSRASSTPIASARRSCESSALRRPGRARP